MLNNIVTFMAKKHPQALFAEFPVSPTSYDQGYRKITYEKLANAVNAAAWWIHEALGGPGKDFETLAYIGINDPRYNILVLAAVQAGYKAAALFTSLIGGIANQTAWIYPLAAAVPSAKVVVDGLKHTKADALAIPPPVVVDLVRQPDLAEYVSKNIDTLIYGGGDLPEAIGSVLTNKMNLLSVYGASEIGLPTAIRRSGTFPSEDWQYVHFHPEIGVEFRHVNENLFELCIVRHSDLEEHQPVFKLFPELQVYKTRDLYTPHPSKPDLWIYKGRADDIIVFLTGEKTNPTTFEHHISSHPEVKAALVIGTRRFQAGLLIELLQEKELAQAERATLIEKIWPAIHEANQVCPAHAKVAKTHILFVDPKKPMARAGKGTVQRQATISMYEQEIDALYADAKKMEPIINGDIERLSGPLTYESLNALVTKLVRKHTGWDKFDENANLYLLGLDSLQTLFLVRDIKLAINVPELAPSTVYTNPSITGLSKAILDISAQIQLSSRESDEHRKCSIEEHLAKHVKSIDELAITSSELKGNVATREPKKSYSSRVVILTGSTGSLGSYILDALLKDNSVSHIYCLNRSSDSKSVQIQQSKSRGLQSEFDDARVTFLSAKASEEHFGLEDAEYGKLVATSTDIILNGWPVNFNIPLSVFNDQFSGIVNFLRFAIQSKNHTSILFVSSISSVLGCESVCTIPEDIILTSDQLPPLPTGYGESKYIAERIFDYAAKKLLVDARIARVGQIAGPIHTTGIWNSREWFPSMIISSLHIGALPNTLGAKFDHIDWVPIDVLAEVLIELLFNDVSTDEKATVFHPYNPSTTSWSDLLPTVVETLSDLKSEPVEVVPYQEWLSRIRSDMESKDFDVEGIKRNPAVKLLDTYESLFKDEKRLDISTTRAQGGSQKLRGSQAIESKWMEDWCRGWFS
ncbi:putative Linear gramicidin synthase subunit D [Glarea lozoyensis 74030]|uniref:Putative Linear gramicidin synthase subunit D n=1 Tax=Glarea lozoyensis (strain ATCC 74030 / MF5533) TaxID=1104152 RepID=H0EIS6_GLAL7|nr:putative Linear gramicidin synthase subunit D [Glarea lozoyensis 74030]